ncbi:MAG TPA: hypothetical protein VEY71_04900 [Chitinophagales bacterium]|nr:hypothetical protein [Chitinophagales bacterium]
MNKAAEYIDRLAAVRNRYGTEYEAEKVRLINSVNDIGVASKKTALAYFDTLQFMTAYPDSKTVYTLVRETLQRLQSHVTSSEKVSNALFNSGVTGSYLTAAFGFVVTKWLRKTRRDDVRFGYFDADDARIQAILSVVMPKVESEIFQDANAEWKGWLNRQRKTNEDLLDQLIAIFDASTIRPEVKDELWNAIGINVEIYFSDPCRLPDRLVSPFFHRALVKKVSRPENGKGKVEKVRLSAADAERIVDCSRMVLVRHLREMDPISFTAPELVSYYKLARGLSIALVGATHDRRHPIDSYMSYTVFKNGLPVAYGGSWILFDSARIALNVFSSYRGGESQFIFQQVLMLHQAIYNLKRFSVDPYQIGKDNSDGIKSGAFWVYYKAGFRPIMKAQRELAEAEAIKLKTTPAYRTPVAALKKLSESRMELAMNNDAVRFDATDLSIAWAKLVSEKFNNNRRLVSVDGVQKLASILNIKDYREPRMNFILENWCGLLLLDEKALRANTSLRKELKELFELKAFGGEEDYIKAMQRANELRGFLERVTADLK